MLITLPSLAGLLILLPFNTGLLMGDKKTTLPIIDREKVNEAIAQIITLDKRGGVYLIISKKTETKYGFVKSNFNYQLPDHSIAQENDVSSCKNITFNEDF